MMLRWLPEDITVHNEDLEGLNGFPYYLLCLRLSVCYLYTRTHILFNGKKGGGGRGG